MNRILPALIIALLVANGLSAQQDAQYTNFMFNKLAFNPAFAGAKEVASLGLLYRNQWYGLKGAPKTVNANFHMPLMNNKMGVGVDLERDELGFTEAWRGSLAYAYRFPVANGNLSIGINGSVKYLGVDWSQADPAELNDNNLPLGDEGKYIPNVGVGAFYYTNVWYAGISVPKLAKGSLDFEAQDGDAELSRERRHTFVMGGAEFPLGDKVKINPNVLMKYVSHAPFDVDANVNFTFMDRITVGGTYRLGDSFDALLHWYITPQLHIGASYDFPLTELRSYNDGTFEVFLGFDFAFENGKVYNPRFF